MSQVKINKLYVDTLLLQNTHYLIILSEDFTMITFQPKALSF